MRIPHLQARYRAGVMAALLGLTPISADLHAREVSLPKTPQEKQKSAVIILPEGTVEPSDPTAQSLGLRSASTKSTTTSSSPMDLPMVPTIRFDVPAGTTVVEQFASSGVIFSGSGPRAIEDGSSSTNPVLSGTPDFDGDISGSFISTASGEPAPVYAMFFDIGGFDVENSVLMEFFAPDGSLLFSRVNDSTGIIRYAAFGGPKGIASWRFSNLSTSAPDGFAIDNLTFSTPGEDNLGEELGFTDCLLGNPVNPLTGNKVQIETDYEQSKPFPLKVERSYNSLTGEWLFLQRLDHVFGSDHAQVIRPDGKRRTFSKLLDSQWLSINPAIQNTLSLSRDAQGAAAGWAYHTSDDMTYHFDIAGRLTAAINRAGVRHDYAYQPGSITVTHSLGGRLVYHLDINGRIERFTDPDGYSYRYDYNTSGLISAFTYPAEIGSPQKLYRYDEPNNSDLLTHILYNDNATTYPFAYWIYDAGGRAIQSSRDTGYQTVTFDYTNLNDSRYPRTTTRNALGKETTYYFTKVNGIRKTFYVAGHASDNCQAANQAYGYYQTGYLYSRRDWNGNTTTYQRNVKGQETRRIEARGTAAERTITTEWHPEFELPVRIEQPGRITTYTYDSMGNLLQERTQDTTAP